MANHRLLRAPFERKRCAGHGPWSTSLGVQCRIIQDCTMYPEHVASLCRRSPDRTRSIPCEP
eukprot:4592875-Pyramimonas_sp.AAC.1